MRINKYIAKSGVASRRNADKLIQEGKIQLNDKIILTPGYDVDLDNDIVKYHDKIIKPIEEKYYFMLNKPVGYVSTNSKKQSKKIIFDLIDVDTKLFSIGRLDKDSRGLILITNDGDIYNRIIHPNKEIFKTYLVRLNKSFLKSHKDKIESGVDIGGYITNRSKLKILTDTTLEIQINEGKNRQIRRMFKAFNYEVTDLFRISIGEIQIKNLEEGKYRKLTSQEIKYLNSL